MPAIEAEPRVTGSSAADDRRVPSARPDWLAGRPASRWDLLVALLIGVGVVVFGYVYRSPLVPTDPWHYVQSAIDFPSKAWVPLGYTRYGMLFLTAPFALLFGDAPASYYAVPLLSAGMLASTLYLLGRRWWGWVAGAVAVVLFFTNSIVLYNLSRGYPDVPSMALIFFSALLALWARDRDFRGGFALAALLVSGFALGMSFETRETSMLAWPLVGAILWRRGRVLHNALVVLVPLLGWAALDVAVGAIAYGDPLLKVHTLMGVRVGVARTDSGELAPTNAVGMPRWWYLLQIPRKANDLTDGWAILAAGAMALVGLIVRNKPTRLMAASFVSVYLLNVAAGGALNPQHPKGKLDIIRYWIQYFPAMYLVVGALVALFGTWLAHRLRAKRDAGIKWLGAAWVVPLLGVLACLGPVWNGANYMSQGPSFAPNGGEALEDLRDHLRGEKVGQVWTDWETKRILPAYQRDLFGGVKVWRGTPMSLTGKGQPNKGDLVLLYSARSSTCDHCRNALAPWLTKHSTPPPDWQLVFQTPERNLVLYRVL